MALRVSLQIDGDASGAEQAAKSAADAVKGLGKDAGDAAKGLEDAFNRATGAADKMAGSSKAVGAANDNATSTASGLVGVLDQVAQKTLGADSAFSKLSGGVAGVVKGVASIGPMVGTVGLLTGVFGLAVTVASTFFGIVNSGGTQAARSLDEQARLVGVVREAYSGAAKAAGEFLAQSKAVTTFQLQQNSLKLKSELDHSAKGLAGDFAKRSSAFSTPFVGLDGQRSTQFDQDAANYRALQGAVDGLNASFASGSADIKGYQDELARIGTAAQKTNPELAKAAAEVLERSKDAASIADKIKQNNDALAVLNGTADKTQKANVGIATTTDSATASFERMLKSLQRQAAGQEAEAAAVGKSAGEAGKLRAQLLLNEAAQQAGISTAGKYAAAIDAVANRFGNAAQKAAEMQLKSGAAFDLSQLGRSSSEQGIANALRGAYGDNVDGVMNSAIANTLRFNAAMMELKGTTLEAAQGAFRDFRTELQNGATMWEAFGKAGVNALNRILDKINDKALDGLVSSIFGSALGGGSSGGSLIGKLIGGSSSGPITLGSAAGPTPFFAAAGGSFGPGWGVVGEQGAELIKVGYGGVTVFPHEVSKPYLPGFATGGNLSALGAVSRLSSSQAAPIQIRGGDVQIIVQGNADDKAIQSMQAQFTREMAKRDAQFQDKVESAVRLAQQGWRLS